jgi:hypothetical protein
VTAAAGRAFAPLRLAVVLLAALALAAAVVRTALVGAYAERQPERAARWWSDHPAVLRGEALAEQGRAARIGAPPGPAARERLNRLALAEPTAIEPLLVAALEARERGDIAKAERLFVIARNRDPRALAPHFFLAEYYVVTGRLREGLAAIAGLARLAPGGAAASAPFIAQVARDKARWPAIRAVFAEQPSLADPVLGLLAADPANARSVIALSGPERSGKSWYPILLDTLVKAGRGREARALWARDAGVADAGALIHDGRFTDGRSPPPFNWQLAGSAIGLTERQRGGGLHVIFHGTQAGALARQLLVLEPGTYRLSAEMRGRIADPRALSWLVECPGAAAPVASLPVERSGMLAGRFTVPAGCGAQWLSLVGRPGDIGGDSEVTIASVALARESRP